jgi:hypothetical protein
MRKLTAPFLFALALAACGSPEQSPECAQYMACQEAVDAQQGSSGAAAIEPLYGPDGTCWTPGGQAAVCTQGCNDGLQAARDTIDPLPAECE